jgi:hypothetical protein
MGLRPVSALWSCAWRRACLGYYRWARVELQAKDPAHPDLPEIVLAIRRLS